MLRERRLLAVSTAFLGMLVTLMGCGTVEDPPWLQDKPPSTTSASTTPTPVVPKPTENSLGSVEVQKGDTLYGISRRYGVSVETVAAVNGLSPPYGLVPGQRLVLPNSSSVSADSKPGAPPATALPGPPVVFPVASTSPPPSSAAVKPDKAKAPPPSSSAAAKPDKAKAPPLSSSAAVKPDKAKAPPLSSSAAVKPDKAKAPPPSSSAAAKPDKAKAPPKPPPSQTKQKPPPPLKPPPRSGKALAWPLRGAIIVPFGPIKEGRRNDGINIAATEGATVKAAENGIVVYAGNELRGFGNLLLIKHSDGWMTAYAHNSVLLVKRGARVNRGQPVAKAGSTGNVRQPQLHFEVRKGSKPVDPLQYLERPAP